MGTNMSGAPVDDWIEGVSSSDRIVDVAILTLRNRLGAVLEHIPLAAENADHNPEHVHMLRLWTRRATAAMGLYKALLPRRRFHWIKKQLKRIRRAANDARDLDVIVQRLEKSAATPEETHWLGMIRLERSEAQKPLVVLHHRLRRDNRFARRIDKLLKRTRYRNKEGRGGHPACFGDFAREHFPPIVNSNYSPSR
jgi:CHAD domain-containing protein